MGDMPCAASVSRTSAVSPRLLELHHVSLLNRINIARLFFLSPIIIHLCFYHGTTPRDFSAQRKFPVLVSKWQQMDLRMLKCLAAKSTCDELVILVLVLALAI